MKAENQVDIKENAIMRLDTELLSILLQDKSSGKNIIWATEDYVSNGICFDKTAEIKLGCVTGIFGQCRGVCFRRYRRKSFFGNTQTFYRRKRKRGSNRFSFVIALALPCGRSYVF